MTRVKRLPTGSRRVAGLPLPAPSSLGAAAIPRLWRIEPPPDVASRHKLRDASFDIIISNVRPQLQPTNEGGELLRRRIIHRSFSASRLRPVLALVRGMSHPRAFGQIRSQPLALCRIFAVRKSRAALKFRLSH